MHMTITDDFSALGLSEQMLAAVRAKGFETPTAIQKLTIPHLLTKRHHRAIADRHGQNRGLRTADTPDPRTRPRADTGHHPRTDTRTRTPGGRRTALLQPRKTALDHGHLRRCGDERTAAAPCQRHRHRRRDTGARARPHPPRHDETGKPTRCSTWASSRTSKRS